jgi:hypothetical protein
MVISRQLWKTISVNFNCMRGGGGGSRILLFKRRLPAEWANRYCTVDTKADAVIFLTLYTVEVNVAYYLLG